MCGEFLTPYGIYYKGNTYKLLVSIIKIELFLNMIEYFFIILIIFLSIKANMFPSGPCPG